MRSRLRLLTLIFIISSLALLVRLFYWQGPMAATLAAKAQYQYASGREIQAHRGNILSHDGSYLAASTQSWLLFASPKVMDTSPLVIANTLTPFLIPQTDDPQVARDENTRILGLLSKKDAVWAPIKHKVTNEVKETIQNLKLEGLGFEEEETRSYPEASHAAQLLGFVGHDDDGRDKGYFGLEGFYDLSLTGKNGYVQRESDAVGTPIFLGESKEIVAASGIDLVTHIDKKIQMTVESNLKEGIERYGAKSGSVVIMDPQTGGILAMAAYPSYDPRTFYEYSNDVFKNPIISDSFEPGSIFKPIIMASGLDAQVVTPDTVCDVCSGPVHVDKYQIETWDNKYYPGSTMTDVIKHSDNVGMVFVGNHLGKDRLLNYLEKFGIGQMTNIDLQGEANPRMRERDTWNIVDQATATFGQGIAVTPIQMVRAISAIANGGKLVTPQVVDKFKGDTWEEDVKPLIGERVISEQAARQMTDIMVQAVSQGEAKWAVPKGFKVAGKTGTAQIPVEGHYDAEKTNASFVGFAPVDNPRFVMLITLREPQTSPWASETSAPLWFKIAKELFPYLGIQPE